MNDYYPNDARKPSRFYVVLSSVSDLGIPNTVTGYVTPFIQQLRSDKIKVTLKTLNIVIETISPTPSPISHVGTIVLLGKSPTNVSADVPEKAILHTFSAQGRSEQVNTINYNSSASDEVAITLSKNDLTDTNTITLALTDLVTFGDASATNTLVALRGVLEITEDEYAQ